MVILLSVVLGATITPLIEGTSLAKIGTNLIALFIVYALLYWVGMARLVRGQILTIKSNDYVLAARATGAKSGRIIRKHIIPNCLAPIIVQATLGVAMAILTAAGLSFVGLGISPPTPEWGSMLSSARSYIRDYAYMTMFPGLAIMITIFALNVLGDGLRDALDPKQKK